MITEDLATCPRCGCKKALTHYSSDTTINWIACPACRKFFDHGVEKKEKDKTFWNNVINDTDYKGENNG